MSVFFDKKCDIYSTTLAKVDGSEIETEVLLYSQIECNFEGGDQLSNDNLSVETDNDTYIVTLPIQYSDVRQGMVIELFENLIWTVGRFKIDSVLVNQSVGGFVDNFYLKTSRI